MDYCFLCGNEQTDAVDRIGDQCRKLIAGHRLKKAWPYFLHCAQRDSRCCGGLATNKDHFYFHGKHWEDTYPPGPEKPTQKARKEWERFSVTVEMGVSFYKRGVRTYYLRDFDSYCDSEEYGEVIPYPKNGDETDEAWWLKVDEQRGRAAEAAFNADMLSCHKCGYHFFETCGCGAKR